MRRPYLRAGIHAIDPDVDSGKHMRINPGRGRLMVARHLDEAGQVGNHIVLVLAGFFLLHNFTSESGLKYAGCLMTEITQYFAVPRQPGAAVYGVHSPQYYRNLPIWVNRIL